MQPTLESTRQPFVTLHERGTPTDLILTLPEFYPEKETNNLGDALKQVQTLEEEIRTLAAASQNDKHQWDALQHLLYYWNHRDLFRITRTNSFQAMVEHALREIVYQTVQTSRPNLECAQHFTQKKAVQELRDRALAHRINNHPLLEFMNQNGLSKEEVKRFLENYYVNNRLFHLFIAALSLTSPLPERAELACNFYDEMGSGDSSLAHPTLFLQSFNTLGLPKTIRPLPEALFLANEKTYAAYICGDHHFGLGGFGFIELTMPGQMEKILNGLTLSGLPKQDLIFWESHITIDLEHGETWFAEMERIIQTPEAAEKALEGGLRLLEARATFYDGVLHSL